MAGERLSKIREHKSGCKTSIPNWHISIEAEMSVITRAMQTLTNLGKTIEEKYEHHRLFKLDGGLGPRHEAGYAPVDHLRDLFDAWASDLVWRRKLYRTGA